MPKKQLKPLIIPEKVISQPDPQPQGNQGEDEDIPSPDIGAPIEAVIPKKRIMSEAQLLNLQKAREAARIKKTEMKLLNDKAKNLKVAELELKAKQFDNIKKQMNTKEEVEEVEQSKPKQKRIVKKVIEVEEEIEDEPKLKPKKQGYNELLYESACDKIKSKIQEERARTLIHSMMPQQF